MILARRRTMELGHFGGQSAVEVESANVVFEKLDPKSEPRRNLQSWSSSNLVFVVVLVSFAAAFPCGISITGMNSTENVILEWVRGVKCDRIGGLRSLGFLNVSGSPANKSTAQTQAQMWCKEVATKEVDKELETNSELSRIWAVVSSIFLLGATVGSLLTNTLVVYTGIKWTIALSTAVFAFGSVCCACCRVAASPELLIFGRFVLGCGFGIFDVVVPVYLTEISPASVRGAAGTMPSVFYRLGFLFGSALAFPNALGNESSWHIIMTIQVVLAIATGSLLPFCPESPRHLLIECNNINKARRSLKWLRKKVNVEEDLDEIRMEKESSKKPLGYIAFLRDCELMRTLSYCAFTAMSQGFCGNDAILLYSNSIFIGMQLNQVTATAASIGLWGAALMATLLSAFLVEKIGRRLLFSVSYIGTLVTLIGFVICLDLVEGGSETANYGSLVCLLANMFFFSVGAGRVPTTFAGELFGQEARTTATSLVQMMVYGSGMVASLLYPIVVRVAKQFTYLIFAGFTLLLTVFVWRTLPETQGKELSSLQKELNDQS